MTTFRDLTDQQCYDVLLKAKQDGFSDAQLAWLWNTNAEEIRMLRKRLGVVPVFKLVDTCAAEFEAYTPYYYSCYETPFQMLNPETNQWETHTESEIRRGQRPSVIILGGGPNRIGQGIEFDYCCCHAAFALQAAGYDAVMVNSNPETVSTDYDTATRLYFEPLTLENVFNIIEVEQPLGVVIQFGGQTPLKLALPLQKAGVPILGTAPDSVDLTEDRKRFNVLLEELGIPQPPGGTAFTYEEALEIAEAIGYPVLVRPSYVLGGRGMVVVFNRDRLKTYMAEAVRASEEHPVLIDKFLGNSIEVDVDAVCDGEQVYIGGIMEHIEYAGVHSGDSACILPPRTLRQDVLDQIIDYTTRLAMRLQVKGLMNIQYAVHGVGTEQRSLAEGSVGLDKNTVFVLEVNPRASRTVPFVSKATGVPLATIAARILVGAKLSEFGLKKTHAPLAHIAVKEAVFPFTKFMGVDTLLGPEMRSTGEVMGIAPDFGTAFAKSQAGANMPLPGWPLKWGQHAVPPQLSGRVFVSVTDRDKPSILPIAQTLIEFGFTLVCTGGTHAFLTEQGLACEFVYKVHEGRPNVIDRLVNEDICLVINTPHGEVSTAHEVQIRRVAVERSISYITTIPAARAAVEAFRAIQSTPSAPQALQDYHKSLSS